MHKFFILFFTLFTLINATGSADDVQSFNAHMAEYAARKKGGSPLKVDRTPPEVKAHWRQKAQEQARSQRLNATMSAQLESLSLDDNRVP